MIYKTFYYYIDFLMYLFHYFGVKSVQIMKSCSSQRFCEVQANLYIYFYLL